MMVKFELFDTECESFKINSFEQLGFADPFPSDPSGLSKQQLQKFQSLPKSADKLVYPESKYVQGQFPMMIFIPRTEIVLKLMKACIGLSDPC